MGFSLSIPQAQACATALRKATADLDAQAAELERVAHEIGNDSDDILTKKGYEDRLMAASGYLKERRESLEKIAAYLDRLVELTTDEEKQVLAFVEKTNASYA